MSLKMVDKSSSIRFNAGGQFIILCIIFLPDSEISPYAFVRPVTKDSLDLSVGILDTICWTFPYFLHFLRKPFKIIKSIIRKSTKTLIFQARFKLKIYEEKSASRVLSVKEHLARITGFFPER